MERFKIEKEKLYNTKYQKNNDYKNKPEYYSMVMDQWKTAVSVSCDISNRRRNMNSFFLSLLTALITIMLTLYSLFDKDLVIIISVSIVGIILCISWMQSLSSYIILNGLKFDIINELESNLPVNLLKYEGDTLKNLKSYKKVAKSEKTLIILFLLLFIGAFIASTVLQIINTFF